MRRPGIEPGSTAWKAAMLTIIPPTLVQVSYHNISTTLGIYQFNATNCHQGSSVSTCAVLTNNTLGTPE